MTMTNSSATCYRLSTTHSPVQNGSLDCRFLKFELYDGSKKASKQFE
jgi:hypothetical protein